MKKKVTHFISYQINGDNKNTYTFYNTSKVSTADASSFAETIHNMCIEIHKESYGFEPNKITVKSVQMISMQLSIFGLRIF